MTIFKRKGNALKKSKNKFRSKKVAGILCLLFSAVVAFVILPILYDKQSDTVTAVQVSAPIAKGNLISSEMVSENKVGSYGISKGFVSDKDKVVGKVAKVDMLLGDTVTSSKIGEYASDPLIDSFKKDGKRLVTVSIGSNAAGMASHLQKGDTVNVACIIESDTYTNMVYTYPELQNLKIYDIENSNAESISDAKKESTSMVSNSDIIIKTVTLIVNDLQANKLIEAEYNGKLHLIFVSREGKFNE